MTVQIGTSELGDGAPVYVIAEIGLNHNGSVDTAIQLIDVAADAGAQAVKFQKRSPVISVILHATSRYPLPAEEANLRTITTLQNRYPGVPIGYSGHECGPQISIAEVALGAAVVERQITLDRTLCGDRTMLRRLSLGVSNTWCAISGSSAKRWATA
ncbi:sialic acid synthase SpsE [Glaciihabitans sp. GrIS 2.15]|nr:sialic acid synthase SpsE [Glaciihabitans sp. GrIS 2.15]